MESAFDHHPGANPEMWDEWIAWQQVVRALEHCSARIDINEEDQLHATLVFWGEALVRLRVTQTEAIRANAMHFAEARMASAFPR